MYRILLFITTLLLVYNTTIGQTIVSGGIFSNITWDVAGSPYIVTDDVVVMTGITLTVSPGVTVRFQDGKTLEVRGYLISTGTITDSINYTSDSNSPTRGIWFGISFLNDLSLDYVSISYAMNGLMNDNFKIINISNSRFYQNITGLDYIGNNVNAGHIENSVFENNNYAISMVSVADYISNTSFINNHVGIGNVFDVLLTNCIFMGHTDKAVSGVGADYVGNTFINNNIGLYIKLYNSTSVIRDNIITNNQIGVQARGDITSTPNTNFYSNTICNNSIYNVQNIDDVSLYMADNCWCTNDSASISNSIFDAHQDLSLGLVFFTPFQSNCATGIDGFQHSTEPNFYPNPFDDFAVLKIENPGRNKYILMLFNTQGSLVQSFSDITSDQIKIDRKNISPGLYFYRLQDDNQVILKGKLIAE